MSGASDVLDPVEAAKNGISSSKHLIASTLDDLTQHHSWLESYHRAERRRAERLRRQEALRRLERRRQRAAWALRRGAAISYARTRKGTAFVIRHGRAFAIWAAPRTRLALARSSRAAKRLARDGVTLTKHGLKAAKRGIARAVTASEDAGIVVPREASARFAVLSAQAAALAAPARRRGIIVWTRTRHRTQAQARTLETRLAGSVMRAALHTQQLFERYAPLQAPQTQRALIVRPSTALVCVEPPVARLPAIRAG